MANDKSLGDRAINLIGVLVETITENEEQGMKLIIDLGLVNVFEEMLELYDERSEEQFAEPPADPPAAD